MSTQKYCRSLLALRNEGVRFRTFMGTRWFIVKAVLLGASLMMVSREDVVVRTVGLVVLGFSVGMAAANIRSYLVAKKSRSLQNEFLDWSQIEECMKGSKS